MQVRTISIVGARPQFIKLAAVCRSINARNSGAEIEDLIVHTGQHYDDGMSSVFFDELRIPEPHINLNVGSGTHAVQTGRMLIALEQVIQEERPDSVIIYGDTNSTLAGALAAAKLGVPVVHIEAGLRSFNRAMPEEINRIAADKLSDILLAPTEVAMRNLGVEGLLERSLLVGDVMHDVVIFTVEIARRSSTILERYGLSAGEFGVVTLHRAENTTAAVLPGLLSALEQVARKIPLVFPMHPRTRGAIKEYLGDWQPPPEITVIEPQGYLDNLRLIDASRCVLTDSGGMQKEALFLGQPCVTLRNETEWEETVACGANVLVGADPNLIVSGVDDALNSQLTAADLKAHAGRLFGSGDAADKVVDAIVHFLKDSR